MGIWDVINSVNDYAQIVVFPLLPYQSRVFNEITESSTNVVVMAYRNLNPFNAYATAISQFSLDLMATIYMIFGWIMLNIVTPLLLIAFLVIFVAVQYYLLRFYYLAIKFVVTKIITLANFVINSPQLQKYAEKVKDLVES